MKTKKKVKRKNYRSSIHLVTKLRNMVAANKPNFINKIKTLKEDKVVMGRSYYEIMDLIDEIEKRVEG